MSSNLSVLDKQIKSALHDLLPEPFFNNYDRKELMLKICDVFGFTGLSLEYIFAYRKEKNIPLEFVRDNFFKKVDVLRFLRSDIISAYVEKIGFEKFVLIKNDPIDEEILLNELGGIIK